MVWWRCPCFTFRGCWDETDHEVPWWRLIGLDETGREKVQTRGGFASLLFGFWVGQSREKGGRGGGFASLLFGFLDGTEPREGASRGLTGGATASPVGTAVATECHSSFLHPQRVI